MKLLFDFVFLFGGEKMANDVVFKTKAFGGFDKTEVMDFVNRIIAEKSELEKKCAEATA